MKPPGASRLIGLTAVVVALAAAVGITGGGRGTVERPLLAPGLDPRDVTTVMLVRTGAPAISISLSDTGAVVEAPVPGPADEATVRDLLSAIATARADRVLRGEAALARAGLSAQADPALRVRLERRGAPPIEIRRGTAQPSSGQVWLGIDDRALLVPAWVAGALDRDLMALRRRRPFPPVSVTGIEIHGSGVDLVLAGSPLRRRDEGTGVRIAPAAVARLDVALGALVLDVLVAGDLAAATLTVRVLGGTAPAELTVHGPCPGHADHVLVDGSAGVGCVASAAISDVVSAAAALTGAGGVQPSLSAGAGEIAAIAGGTTVLARRGAAWQLVLDGTTVDADDDAVRRFFDILALEGMPGPPPVGAADATWTVTLDGGSSETWRWYLRGARTLVRRDEEPAALILPAPSADAYRSFGPRLRDRTLLSIEPTRIAALGATGTAPASLRRGTLVGEWIVESPAGGTDDPTAVVDALASLRAASWLDGASALGPIRRTLTVTLDPPPMVGAQPIVHTIAIGAARGDGCAARIDALPAAELSAATCAALMAPIAR